MWRGRRSSDGIRTGPWGEVADRCKRDAGFLRSSGRKKFILVAIRLTGRNDFVEVMEMLDKRLNDKGKNWRHVFKVCNQSFAPCTSHPSFSSRGCGYSRRQDAAEDLELTCVQALTVLDYVLHAGSENVVIYFRDNIYIVKCVLPLSFLCGYVWICVRHQDGACPIWPRYAP